MNLLFISALKTEIDPLKSILTESYIIDKIPEEVSFSFLTTGMGEEKSSRALEKYLESEKADLVVNTGFCGGLNEEFGIGEIVQVNSVCSELKYDNKIHLKRLSDKLRLVSCCTVKTPIDNSSGRSQIMDLCEADVVDMELFRLAEIAGKYKLPLNSIKIISDIAGKSNLNEVKKNAGHLAKLLAERVAEILREDLFREDSFGRET